MCDGLARRGARAAARGEALERLLALVRDGRLAAGSAAVHAALVAEYGRRAPRYRTRLSSESEQHRWYYLVTGAQWDGERATWRAALMRTWNRNRTCVAHTRNMAVYRRRS